MDDLSCSERTSTRLIYRTRTLAVQNTGYPSRGLRSFSPLTGTSYTRGPAPNSSQKGTPARLDPLTPLLSACPLMTGANAVRSVRSQRAPARPTQKRVRAPHSAGGPGEGRVKPLDDSQRPARPRPSAISSGPRRRGSSTGPTPPSPPGGLRVHLQNKPDSLLYLGDRPDTETPFHEKSPTFPLP